MKADLDCQRHRPLRRKLLVVLVAACYGAVQAAPVNPTVVAGQASFNFQGKTYSITNTPNTIINWQGFSLGADEVARFIQQSADSKVLNRITGQDPSRILGALQSNGKVFLINPNGVLFGAGSRVDVGGLVASSLAISNADFLAGKNSFGGGADAGKVVNQGSITTPGGGQIFLVAPAVENSGVISSPNGQVVLAAGRSVQLFDSSDPNVQVVVSAPADQALNLGAIVARGGRVGVYGALVTQRGTINADSAVMGANGKIVLKSSRTTLLEAGSTTSARGTADGNLNTGGDIVLLGPQVGLTGNAVVDASGGAGGGTVLVGGDYQGRNAAVPNAQQAYVGKDSVIRADATGRGDGGKVIVWSDRATRVLGAISARGGAAGGNGGLVETSGHYLDMQGTVDTRAPLGATGTLLLDPSDIYIASDSGAAAAAGMTAGGTASNNGGVFTETGANADSLLLTSTLQNALATTDVTVSTANGAGSGGKISVVSPLVWTSAHGLTLNADGAISLGRPLSAGGDLTLNAGGDIAALAEVRVGGTFTLAAGNWSQRGALPVFAAHDFRLDGGTFVRAAGGDGSATAPYLLADAYGLQGAATLPSSTWFSLAGDIDAHGTAAWNAGQGFAPIGNNDHPYAGTFNGNGHAIAGLTIERAGAANVGLFSVLGTGTIKNLTLDGGSVRGGANVGAVAGLAHAGGVIDNVHASAAVTGVSNVGGLVGDNGAAIVNASASGAVTGMAGVNASDIGGLAGRNVGTIGASSASGDVNTTGFGYSGGLVGSNTNDGARVGAITASHADGKVTSTGEIVGGLVGDNNGGTISVAYATGDVQGGRNVGGLVGRNAVLNGQGGSVADVYATGDVGGNALDANLSHRNMGGLLGELFSGSVSNGYSGGGVDGAAFSGGVNGMLGALVSGSLNNGYFNADAAGTASDAVGTALTGKQSRLQSSYAGFDFSSVWRNYDGHTTPLLKGLLTPRTIVVSGGGSGVTKTYDGASAAFTGTASGVVAGIDGTLGYDGAVNAGTYEVGGLWSTRYDISYTGTSARLTIQPRTVTATVSGSKTYDGVAYMEQPATFAFSNLVGDDTLGVSGLVRFSDKNAGTGKAMSVTDPTLTNNELGNYVLGGGISGSGSITRAPLALAGLGVASRHYDGTAVARLGGSASVSGINGDDVALTGVVSGTATFNNKNVGADKPVTVGLGGLGLTGADAGNYVLVSPPELVGEITPATLTVAGFTANNRVYNLDYDSASATVGRRATLSGGALGGVIGNDQVAIGGANATFADKNVGMAKAVTVNGVTLGGADAGNYVVASLPTGLTADITPAALTVSLAARDYNNSAAGTFADATLGGVLGADVVALAAGGATAAYADKNAGVDKVVAIGGSVGLSGTDAGNYRVALAKGTITPRALATWTASGGGLWSDAGNWQDGVAPSGANVLAAALNNAGGVVTYDSGAGATTLTSLRASGQGLRVTGGALTLTGIGDAASYANGGGLMLGGGALVVNGELRISNLALGGGLLSGTGGATRLDVGTLAQSGGGIDIDGALAVGNGGNISIGNVRAKAGITLNATQGAITQSGALVTDSLHAFAANGVALTDAGNHIGAFEAVVGGGNIALKNTVSSGELALGGMSTGGNIVIDNTGGIHTTGDIAGAGGLVSITAHSPITINNEISAANIVLDASGDIRLAQHSSLNAGATIGLSAGGNIVLGGKLRVPSSGSISATAANNITSLEGTTINSGGGAVTLTTVRGAISVPSHIFIGQTVPTLNDGAAAADAAAKAAADAAAKAAADAAAKAAADAAAKAAADAAAKAAADAAAKAAADAAAQAAADAAAKAAADAAAQAAADAAAKAAADASAKAAADAAAQAAAKAAADAAAKAAADAASAKAAADVVAVLAATQGRSAEPVGQALNATVNVINAVTTSAPKAGANAPSQTKQPEEAKNGGTAPDKELAARDGGDGAKASTAAKKMYCN